MIVDLGDVEGTTVEVPEGGTIDLTGDDETYTAWTADIADPAVVEFVPGRDDGSAQFNPGLTAKSEGETEVTLDNGETGDSRDVHRRSGAEGGGRLLSRAAAEPGRSRAAGRAGARRQPSSRLRSWSVECTTAMASLASAGEP